MKKYVFAVLTVLFMLAVSCEKEETNEELYKVATDGGKVKRPGGGS